MSGCMHYPKELIDCYGTPAPSMFCSPCLDDLSDRLTRATDGRYALAMLLLYAGVA